MMTLERAIATIANETGHSREVILEAAQVLRQHVPASPPTDILSDTSRIERYERAKDRLLLAIAEGLHLSLRHTYNLVGHSAQFSPALTTA